MSVILKSQKILSKWVDYNNHLNMAYYILIFDQAWEVMLGKIKMGAHSAKTSKRSTMVVETHTQYINEVKENEEVDIILTFFDETLTILKEFFLKISSAPSLSSF